MRLSLIRLAVVLLSVVVLAGCDAGEPEPSFEFDPDGLIVSYGPQDLGRATFTQEGDPGFGGRQAIAMFLGSRWVRDQNLTLALNEINDITTSTGRRLRFVVQGVGSLDELAGREVEMSFTILQDGGSVAVGVGRVYFQRAENRRFEGVLAGITTDSQFSTGGVEYSAAFNAVPSL